MPTETRNVSRSCTSRTTRLAIARSVSVSSRSPIHSSAAFAESREYSAIERPPTVTARLSGRSRAPPHAGQGCSAIRPSIRSRVFSESVSW